MLHRLETPLRLPAARARYKVSMTKSTVTKFSEPKTRGHFDNPPQISFNRLLVSKDHDCNSRAQTGFAPPADGFGTRLVETR